MGKLNERFVMLFGDSEIKEYEKDCKDPFVLAIIKRLWESKSNASKWLSKCVELENHLCNIDSLIETIDYQREKIDELERKIELNARRNKETIGQTSEHSV